MHEKGTNAQKLTEQQNVSHRLKSSIRCRVEHVFGFVTNTMKAMYVSTISIERAEAKIGIVNLTYNLMRCMQLGKQVYCDVNAETSNYLSIEIAIEIEIEIGKKEKECLNCEKRSQLHCKRNKAKKRCID